MTELRFTAERARSDIEEAGRLAALRKDEPANDAWLNDVTAIVKAFERPCCVARLIVSIRRYYPSLKILVCDDSKQPLYPDASQPIAGVTWLTLPFEWGHTLGAGRNHLVDRATTKYVFLCDDDHEFTSATRLKPMWSFLETSGYDIVGGAQGSDDYGTALFERDGPRIIQRFYAHRGEIAPDVVACDRVSNTFLARTQALRRVRWQAEVYAHEHADFFIRAGKAGLKIAQMGRIWVGHDRSCEPGRGLLGRIFGTLISHRDKHYNLLRSGGRTGQSQLAAKTEAERLYRKHVLDEHGVTAIDDEYNRKRRRDLMKLIGKPSDPPRSERAN